RGSHIGRRQIHVAHHVLCARRQQERNSAQRNGQRTDALEVHDLPPAALRSFACTRAALVNRATSALIAATRLAAATPPRRSIGRSARTPAGGAESRNSRSARPT